ncbi:MAG TPA: hypothetical protein VKU19_22970 [Bryobacteraceae bacterium]|nr:hypothetical protein [Bryobacteraceae bacterium]
MFYKHDMDRALSLYEQLAAHDPSNEIYPREIALVSRILASDAGDRHDYAKQRALIDRAGQIDRRRVKRKPIDREARLELSFDLSMLATWHENVHDDERALGNSRKSS